MSISLKKVRAKWAATENVKLQKIALSESKLARMHGAVVLTIILFSLVYLIQVNTLATKGYAIQELQKNVATQKKLNDEIGMQIIQAQSMMSIQKKIDALQLVKADHISYINGEPTVATAGTIIH